MKFEAVLGRLRVDRLPTFASHVRSCGHSSTGKTPSSARSQSLGCKVDPKTKCGSYHVVITLSFTDKRSWILKIPAKGIAKDWSPLLGQALESEAETMRLLRRETTIPIPEIYAFDASIDNELGCPFILMEKVKGRPMYHGWYDTNSSPAKENQFRIKVLHGIAEAMVQLNKFTFNQSGALLFDGEGRVSGVGSRYLADSNLLYDKECDGTFKDEDDLPFSEIRPFDSATSYFLNTLKNREGKNEDECAKGADILARNLIDWGLNAETSSHNNFVLAQSDLDTQNIFTLKDGTLSGIIDWDWVAAVPPVVGCHKFPLFLTADYNPSFYEFDITAGEATNDSGECSPAELASYREMYAHFVESLTDKATADRTRRSAVMGSLEVAANTPMDTLAILGHLFDEISQIPFDRKEEISDVSPEVIDMVEEEEKDRLSTKEIFKKLGSKALIPTVKWPVKHLGKIFRLLRPRTRQKRSTDDEGNFAFKDVCIALSKGSLDKQRMRRLKNGFLALLNQAKQWRE